MFFPLPANSLMQSAQHVTAHVHIHFWISKQEDNSDDSCSIEYKCNSFPAHWHTLHFVAVNEDVCGHCIRAHSEYGETMFHNVTTDSENLFASSLNC